MGKSIMIQGTMSSAGKSLIATALCRIFKQDGYKVAPFKAQNIALNSYITKDGLEMGRAQVVQAEAAGIEPHVNMNPILLKPTRGMGTQVVLNGKVHCNMTAINYMEQKQIFMSEVMKAYHELEEKYDIIVLEGAGSPAEININSDDIVNMGMAKKAKAPVILVGDIDRGGVFASLYGTVMLLDSEERNFIKATIVNKFRGEMKYFENGVQMLKEKTGVPVAGVVPYLQVDIDDEDSVSDRISGRNNTVDDEVIVDIAVINLPHLSNFTDFNAFQRIKGVSLRYINSPTQLKNPDMIIIPGTKNTMNDLSWLRENGLEEAIKKLAAKGTSIFGICGGYQILGQSISDPYGVEYGGNMKGMGLLDIETIFDNQKRTTQVKGKFENIGGILSPLAGMTIEGYEIHMGQSEISCKNFMVSIHDLESNDIMYDGCSKENVYGTYIHGIFDEIGICEKIVECLAKAKGIEFGDLFKIEEYNSNYEYKEKQYDLLAEEVRKNIDMDLIYKIIKEGV